jgi:hypothetical protein
MNHGRRLTWGQSREDEGDVLETDFGARHAAVASTSSLEGHNKFASSDK